MNIFLTYVLPPLAAYIFGVISNPIGDWITDFRRNKELNKSKKLEYRKLCNKFPQLMESIKSKLKINPNFRDIHVCLKQYIISEDKDSIEKMESEYLTIDLSKEGSDLLSKQLTILCRANYIVSGSNSTYYLKEELVDLF